MSMCVEHETVTGKRASKGSSEKQQMAGFETRDADTGNLQAAHRRQLDQRFHGCEIRSKCVYLRGEFARQTRYALRVDMTRYLDGMSRSCSWYADADERWQSDTYYWQRVSLETARGTALISLPQPSFPELRMAPLQTPAGLQSHPCVLGASPPHRPKACPLDGRLSLHRPGPRLPPVRVSPLATDMYKTAA